MIGYFVTGPPSPSCLQFCRSNRYPYLSPEASEVSKSPAELRPDKLHVYPEAEFIWLYLSSAVVRVRMDPTAELSLAAILARSKLGIGDGGHDKG
jgi:hypothetical protein